MYMKRIFLIIGISATLLFGIPFAQADLRCLTTPQGGTGICSATSTDIGKALIVSSTSPFQYKFGTTGSGSVTATGTVPYFPYFTSTTTLSSTSTFLFVDPFATFIPRAYFASSSSFTTPDAFIGLVVSSTIPATPTTTVTVNGNFASWLTSSTPANWTTSSFYAGTGVSSGSGTITQETNSSACNGTASCVRMNVVAPTSPPSDPQDSYVTMLSQRFVYDPTKTYYTNVDTKRQSNDLSGDITIFLYTSTSSLTQSWTQTGIPPAGAKFWNVVSSTWDDSSVNSFPDGLVVDANTTTAWHNFDWDNGVAAQTGNPNPPRPTGAAGTTTVYLNIITLMSEGGATTDTVYFDNAFYGFPGSPAIQGSEYLHLGFQNSSLGWTQFGPGTAHPNYIGVNTIAPVFPFEIATDTAITGNGNLNIQSPLGATNVFTGTGGFAVGLGNITAGLSMTVGATNTSQGLLNFNIGAFNTVSTTLGTAIGFANLVTGSNGIAMGDGSSALNSDTFAFGYRSVASGPGAFAFGNNGVKATGVDSMAFGSISSTVSGTSSILFTLGGSSYTLTQPNTLSVVGGQVTIGTTTPNGSGVLTVIGNSYFDTIYPSTGGQDLGTSVTPWNNGYFANLFTNNFRPTNGNTIAVIGTTTFTNGVVSINTTTKDGFLTIAGTSLTNSPSEKLLHLMRGDGNDRFIVYNSGDEDINGNISLAAGKDIHYGSTAHTGNHLEWSDNLSYGTPYSNILSITSDSSTILMLQPTGLTTTIGGYLGVGSTSTPSTTLDVTGTFGTRGAQYIHRATVNTSNYFLSATSDYYLSVTPANPNSFVYLPAITTAPCSSGFVPVYIVKDSAGTAATFPIVVTTTNGANTIDLSGAGFTINKNFQSATFVSNCANNYEIN